MFINNSYLVLALYAGYPATISYMIDPNVHQSTAFPWFPSRTSGAKYSGVPHLALSPSLPLISLLESPKSVSFMYPSLSIRVFSGFKLIYKVVNTLDKQYFSSVNILGPRSFKMHKTLT